MSELSEPTVQRFRKIRLVKNSKVIDKGKYNGTPHYWLVLYLGYDRLPERLLFKNKVISWKLMERDWGRPRTDHRGAQTMFCLTKKLFPF